MNIGQGLLVGVLLFAGVLVHGQEVRINAFTGNGAMTWQAPSNSDCTVEWASSLTSSTRWSRSWIDLLDLHCMGGVSTGSIPMFYRVSAWTNGLFMRMPVGRTLVFAVSNALGQTWAEEISSVGRLTIPAMTNDYMAISVSEHYQGGRPSGMMVDSINYLRSSDRAMYGFQSVGSEQMDWQDAPMGTTWTNGTEVVTLEAKETVTVPAGTFTGCLKFTKTDTSIPPPNTWREWVKPGFFMVKWMDSNTGNENDIPVVYQLESWWDDAGDGVAPGACPYFPMGLSNQWNYAPSFGDGPRVDTISGAAVVNGTNTYTWERQEPSPDNYHETRTLTGIGGALVMRALQSNEGLSPGTLKPRNGVTSRQTTN